MPSALIKAVAKKEEGEIRKEEQEKVSDFGYFLTLTGIAKSKELSNYFSKQAARAYTDAINIRGERELS